MASGQIRSGDCIRVGHHKGSASLLFFCEAEAVETRNLIGRATA
jgi:hypothetical protein